MPANGRLGGHIVQVMWMASQDSKKDAFRAKEGYYDLLFAGEKELMDELGVKGGFE